MRAVLYLYPVLRSAAPIRPVSALRDQASEPNIAGCAEKVGADLALLERADEDAVRPARKVGTKGWPRSNKRIVIRSIDPGDRLRSELLSLHGMSAWSGPSPKILAKRQPSAIILVDKSWTGMFAAQGKGAQMNKDAH
jgi:hypothetical protein